MACVVPGCSHRMGVFSENNSNLSFHRFPADFELKNEWIKNIRKGEEWSPTQFSRICSAHFEVSCFRQGYIRKILHSHAVPTIFVNHPLSCQPKLTKKRKLISKYDIDSTASTSTATNYEEQVSEQEVQPGPSKALGTTTSLDPNASTIPEQDPLSRVIIEQCRFCGEFSKDCISVSSNMPYLAHNKTTLVLNHTSVQLDFNDGSLPNTVCRDCDAKLQEIADFVKVVKAAQDKLINVAEERAEFAETRVEFEEARAEETVDTETDTLVIKTEYESEHEESDDDKEDKEGIVDSLTVGETVFVKKTITNKRKSDTVTAKPKKPKTKKGDDELIIDIKEEVIEKDGQGQSEVSDYVKPSELELATSALVFEMAGEGTSEYQGYRSDR